MNLLISKNVEDIIWIKVVVLPFSAHSAIQVKQYLDRYLKTDFSFM